MAEERIAIYTALYGGYDEVPTPVAQDVPTDFLCFTDDPGLRADGWQVVPEAPRYEDPRMCAKVHKMLAATVVPDHRWALWVDANVLVDNPAFAREAVEVARRSPHGVTVWRHPQRDCIYQELRLAMSMPKCDGQPLAAQAEAYRREGYPEHGGLFGCRGIAWDTTSPVAAELGNQWLAECERWSFRDQVSFPVVAGRLGVRPGIFPHHLTRHRPPEAMTCWLRQRAWGERLLDAAARGRRVTSGFEAVGGREGGHPVPRAWWAIGNPWFDTVPHARST